MAGNNPTPAATLSKISSRNRLIATGAPAAVGKAALGGLHITVLLPDVLYLQKSTENVMAGPDGTIGITAFVISWLIAVTTMVGLTVAIHLWFARVTKEMQNSLYFWLAMLSLVVVTIQPLGLILEQAGQAGSGFGDNNPSAGSKMAFWSSVLQILALPVCAIIASLGLGIFLDGLRDYRDARSAGEHSVVQSEGAAELLKGEREAHEVANVLRETEAQMKSDWVHHTHAAVIPIASAYELYVEGKAPAPTRATFEAYVADVVEAEATPGSAQLASMVRDVMPELLPIEALPQNGSLLPRAARDEIRAYARWIKRTFSRRSLHAAL